MKFSPKYKIILYSFLIFSIYSFVQFSNPPEQKEMNISKLSSNDHNLNQKTENKKWDHGKINVSEKGRFLEHTDGTPFLWIGDTGWELFDRLTTDKLEIYFQDRKNKGFTVIQAVLFMHDMNVSGHSPFVNNNPSELDEDFWQWADKIIHMAGEYNLYVCLLPLFGYQIPKFDVKNATDYGEFLGKRYKNVPNIFWMMGGDRNPCDEVTIWEALAKGIKKHDQNHLMTYHPAGNQTSTYYFQGMETSWMDFNSYQSGHGTNNPNTWIFGTQGSKPILNSEAAYEDIVVSFWINCSNHRITDQDIRKDAYRSVFAGSFGHTYGQSDVWQFRRIGDMSKACSNGYWFDGIHSPGSGHMLYLANLLVSRPVHRTRDMGMFSNETPGEIDHMEATRGVDYAFIYFPTTIKTTVQLGKISGNLVKCYWYNPRSGENMPLGTFKNTGTKSFTPPADSLDYILVIDDVDKQYNPPGAEDLWYGI